MSSSCMVSSTVGVVSRNSRSVGSRFILSQVSSGNSIAINVNDIIRGVSSHVTSSSSSSSSCSRVGRQQRHFANASYEDDDLLPDMELDVMDSSIIKRYYPSAFEDGEDGGAKKSSIDATSMDATSSSVEKGSNISTQNRRHRIRTQRALKNKVRAKEIIESMEKNPITYHAEGKISGEKKTIDDPLDYTRDIAKRPITTNLYPFTDADRVDSIMRPNARNADRKENPSSLVTATSSGELPDDSISLLDVEEPSPYELPEFSDNQIISQETKREPTGIFKREGRFSTMENRLGERLRMVQEAEEILGGNQLQISQRKTIKSLQNSPNYFDPSRPVRVRVLDIDTLDLDELHRMFMYQCVCKLPAERCCKIVSRIACFRDKFSQTSYQNLTQDMVRYIFGPKYSAELLPLFTRCVTTIPLAEFLDYIRRYGSFSKKYIAGLVDKSMKPRTFDFVRYSNNGGVAPIPRIVTKPYHLSSYMPLLAKSSFKSKLSEELFRHGHFLADPKKEAEQKKLEERMAEKMLFLEKKDKGELLLEESRVINSTHSNPALATGQFSKNGKEGQLVTGSSKDPKDPDPTNQKNIEFQKKLEARMGTSVMTAANSNHGSVHNEGVGADRLPKGYCEKVVKRPAMYDVILAQEYKKSMVENSNGTNIALTQRILKELEEEEDMMRCKAKNGDVDHQGSDMKKGRGKKKEKTFQLQNDDPDSDCVNVDSDNVIQNDISTVPRIQMTRKQRRIMRSIPAMEGSLKQGRNSFQEIQPISGESSDSKSKTDFESYAFHSTSISSTIDAGTIENSSSKINVEDMDPPADQSYSDGIPDYYLGTQKITAKDRAEFPLQFTRLQDVKRSASEVTELTVVEKGEAGDHHQTLTPRMIPDIGEPSERWWGLRDRFRFNYNKKTYLIEDGRWTAKNRTNLYAPVRRRQTHQVRSERRMKKNMKKELAKEILMGGN